MMRSNNKKIKVAILIAGFIGLSSAMSADQNISEELYRKSHIKSINPQTMSAATRELFNNWQELKKRQLSLLPVPKKIKFSENPVTLDSNAVIVLKNKTARGAVAVHEINSMVKDISGKALEVFDAVQGGKYNIIIDNSEPNFFTEIKDKYVKSNNPYCRKQAYAIEPVKDGIRLGGDTSIGTLYAAVTLRFLISGNDSGEAVLHPAFVVDWPDIALREPLTSLRLSNFRSAYKTFYNKRPTDREYLKYAKQVYDFILRSKGNAVSNSTSRIMHFTIYNAPETLNNKRAIAAAAALREYVKSRGIQTRETVATNLGNTRKGDENRPELKDCMTNFHGAYSWAKSDLHKQKAEKVAEYCRLYNVDLLTLHFVDAGSIFDPQDWSKRDKFTKTKFGDDLKAADLSVFNIYREALKGIGVEIGVVMYPYTPEAFDLAWVMKTYNIAKPSRNYARKAIEKTTKYETSLLADLPADTAVTIREAPDKYVNIMMKKVVGGNPVLYYLQPWARTGYGFMRLLPLTFSSCSAIYRPGRQANDYLFANTIYSGEMGGISAAEYSWNCFFPGKSDLNEGKDYEFYSKRGPALEDIIADRTATGLWGGGMSDKLKEVLKNDVSLSLGMLPTTLRRKQKYDNLIGMLEKNQHALVNSVKIFDEIWQEIAPLSSRQKNQLISSFKRPAFIKYRLFYKAALAWNYARLAHEKAMKELKDGNFELSRKILLEGLKNIKRAEADYNKAKQEMHNEAIGILRNDLVSYKLYKPEFDKMYQLLTKLRDNLDAIYRAGFLPPWYKDFMSKKTLIITKVDKGPPINGKFNNDIWQKAFPIEMFICLQTPKFAPNPLQIKLLADDKYLYLGGKIDHPGLSKRNIVKGTANIWKQLEGVELFLNGHNSKTYYQFALDAGGNLYAAHCEAVKPRPQSKPISRKNILYKVNTQADTWTFEMRILWSELSGLDRRKSNGIVCYNYDSESGFQNFSNSWLVGKNFHFLNGYGILGFVSEVKPKDLEPEAQISISETVANNVVTSIGSGANLTFRIIFAAKRPAKDLSCTIRILNASGKNACAPLSIKQDDYVGPAFLSDIQQVQLPIEHKRLSIMVNAKYKTLDGKDYTATSSRNVDVKAH